MTNKNKLNGNKKGKRKSGNIAKNKNLNNNNVVNANNVPGADASNKKALKFDKRMQFGLVTIFIIFSLVLIKIVNIIITNNQKYDLSGEEYYQYFYGIMEEFSGKMEVVQKNDNIELILEDKQVIYLDSTPIYYKNILGKALIATKMQLVIPDQGNYRLRNFTTIINENKTMYLKKFNKKERAQVDHGFLYDGNDLYFFLEKTVINAGGEEYIVSPLSYAIVNYKQNVEIYDYEKEEYIILQNEEDLKEDVTAKSLAGDYTINMSVDSLTSKNNSQLLFTNVNNLQEFQIK